MTTEPSFNGKHSRSMRIWHWASFLTMSGSLVTVLFAKTLFNTSSNIPLVQDTLNESKISVTPEQAKSVSHEFNDLLWHWHTYIGYVLSALFLFRIIFEFFQPNEQKVIPILKNTLKALKMPGADKKYLKHYLLVRWLYVVFYFSLFVQACTGLFMEYSDDLDNLKNIRNTVSDIHSFNMWVILSFIFLHLGGVILSELGKKNKGVVSEMINGGQ